MSGLSFYARRGENEQVKVSRNAKSKDYKCLNYKIKLLITAEDILDSQLDERGSCFIKYKNSWRKLKQELP